MSFRAILVQRAKKNVSLSLLLSKPITTVLKGFVFTEKGYNAESGVSAPTYVFYVDSHANKNDIKAAVKYLYGVDVLSVRTVIMPQKKRSSRGLVRKSFKKAYVTIAKGQEISLA